MQSLLDILGSKDFDTPPEISIIKDFVRKNFNQADCEVKMHPYSITILVRSASLAGALRGKLHHLQKELPGDHKLFIRIG
jgi:hypothetical protein